jgi:hypothetical protein
MGGQAVHIGERRSAYKDLIGKLEGRDLGIDDKILNGF